MKIAADSVIEERYLDDMDAVWLIAVREKCLSFILAYHSIQQHALALEEIRTYGAETFINLGMEIKI